MVEIRHRSGYASRYAHLRGFTPGLRAGARVRQGDVIGYVGSTGMSTGPHLHYEFHMGGRPVNPASIRYITGEPIPGSARSRFRGMVAAQLSALERGAAAPRSASAE